MLDQSGHKITARISVRLKLAMESHTDFMKTVDADIARLITSKGSDAVQAIATTGGQLGTVLQKLVPIIDSFATVRMLVSKIDVLLNISLYRRTLS